MKTFANIQKEIISHLKSSARVYQGYSKGIRFAATILVLLWIGVGNVWGAEGVIYTLEPTTGSNENYANDCDVTINSIKWNITGNSKMLPWRIGGKSITKTDRVIYSKTAISDNVTKIEVIHGAASSINVNSMTVIVSKNSNFSSPVSTLTPSFVANNTVTINRPDGKDWSNCYYKIVYNVTVSGSSNKFVEFRGAKFYADVSSCEKITTAPTVTATAGNARIDLSWSNQTGATSYTVTKTPAGGTVGTPSKSGSTWSCAITGLTNGTAYTWTVTPVGDGTTYCAEGNTAASATATPNISRTITYYDKDGQHTTYLADGTNIANALNALYGVSGPTSCDATNYKYFVGWKEGAISGTASSVTLLDDEVVNASSPSNNYYAVWSDTDPSAGGSELFSFEGGTSSGLTGMTGVTASGLGTDYAESNAPYRIKLDGTGDYVIIAIASQPSKVTIGVKMIGGSSTSSITVQESTAADGTFTDVEALSISGAQNDVLTLETSASFKSTTRAVKLYFTKGSNVGLGPITIEGTAGNVEYITTCSAPCTSPGTELSITGSSSVNMGSTLSLGTSGGNGGTVTWSVVAGTGAATINSSGVLTPSSAGTVTVKAHQDLNGSVCAQNAEKAVTIAATFEALTYYTLVTDVSELSDGDLITIGSGIGNSTTIKILHAQASNNRDTKEVTTTAEGKILETDISYPIRLDNDANGWKLYDTNNSGYLYATKGNNYLKNSASPTYNDVWKIAIVQTSGSYQYQAQIHLEPCNSNGCGQETRNNDTYDRYIEFNGTTLSAYLFQFNDGYIYKKELSCERLAAPTGLSAGSLTQTTATLSWTAVANASGYEVSLDNGSSWTSAGTNTSYSATSLTQGTTYNWKVRATGDGSTYCAKGSAASSSFTTKRAVKVTYTTNGATGGTLPVSGGIVNLTEGDPHTVLDNTGSGGSPTPLTKTGYTWAGWHNSTTYNATPAYTVGETITVTENITLYANWMPKRDTFIDGVHGTADQYGDGANYTVPSCSDQSRATSGDCEQKHYKFIGWALIDADLTNPANIISAGGTRTATGATYYAVWGEEL